MRKKAIQESRAVNRKNKTSDSKNTSLGSFYQKYSHPEIIGISLDEHGRADVEELISGIRAAGHPDFDMSALEEIVETNNKQRYSFSADKVLIRANQGHSIPVDVELPVVSPPDMLWHGTGEQLIPSII